MKKYISLVLAVFFLLLFSVYVFAEQVIGVSSFTNLTGDKSMSWLEVGIAESVSYKLRNIQDYIVIDRVNVDKVVNEVQLGQSGLLDDTKASRQGPRRRVLLSLEYMKSNNRIRINAKLIEVESHKILKRYRRTVFSIIYSNYRMRLR